MAWIGTPGTTGRSRSVPGRFPSTTWGDHEHPGTATTPLHHEKATASYGWTVYDFAVPSAALAAGTHTVRLQESGADPRHAAPFASFALRWPWGFRPLHSSPVYTSDHLTWSTPVYSGQEFTSWPVSPLTRHRSITPP